ncbi:arginase [Flavobacterium rivuli WB 3.3-2 = DSM 21788]|uniref:Arginase n=1 Tax=Flavobacterium rivuli WB 3.3-2 = DSM 21788 TaxID=1121895 RepID=A0A0A2M892_9FLAO|nr:formimidoylglutamase [Flavobacterium rivuli]KGO88494.1 arginase [Flavobacterium rivuli WB 3.3-2 = DSM 21788]
MENIIRFTAADLLKCTNQRSGEIKFGERVQLIPAETSVYEALKSSDAEFVLLGIPEDAGVRANNGRPGAALAWESAVQTIVNLQHNKFCKGNRLLILGRIDVTESQKLAETIDQSDKEGRKELSKIVEKIDKDVAYIICQIVKAGKVPIIIGGGQNNAYGSIKGTSLAKGKPVNAINYDPYPDFRVLDRRHSSNGFMYAFEEGFLKNYFIFGVFENYASKGVIETIKKYTERIRYNTYEQIAIRKEKHFSEEMALAVGFIGDDPFGLEIDLEALPNVGGSIMTNTGFSIEKARQFVHYFGESKNVAYLHISEGAPQLGDEKNPQLTGRLIAHLVTDFMKAKKVV